MLTKIYFLLLALLLAAALVLITPLKAQTPSDAPAGQHQNQPNVRPPVTQDDIKIVQRAREILNSPKVWNRADNRICPPDAKTFSLYCALEKATNEISGNFAHRGAAMQEARFVIDAIAPDRKGYQHRLMGYNNDPATTFADIQKVLKLEEERITQHLQEQSGMSSASPLPAPTGHYFVGRTHFNWVDESRPDLEMPGGHRELAVWVWYPASPEPGTEQAEWMPGKWGDNFWSISLKEFSDLSGQKNPLHTIRTHSYADAPLTSALKTYPVLLFEPGLGFIPLEYATLIEDVVSHGCVVAAVVPTYYTKFTVLSGDRVILTQKIRPEFPPGSDKRTSPDQTVGRHDGQTVYMTPKQLRTFQTERRQFSEQMPIAWTADMIFTLNQLEKLSNDTKSPFKDRLDLTQVGAFGHSLGGATSFQVAKDDSRVRAAIDIDGVVDAQSVEQMGLPKPLLIFRGGEAIQEREQAKSAPSDDDMRKALEGLDSLFSHGKPGYRITLPGTTHGFSTDLGVLPFLPKAVIAEMGTMDPKRALTITNVYVEDFFGEYLADKKSDLLNGPSPEYPEITFETNK